MPAFTEWLKRALLEVQEYTKLAVATARCAVTRPFYWHDFVEQLDAIGIGSMTVVDADRPLHRRGAGAAVGLHARSVRRPAVRRPPGERLDDQGAGPGADGADAGRPRQLGHRRRARLDDGDRPDQRAARARHRPGAQAGGAAGARRHPDDADPHGRRQHRRPARRLGGVGAEPARGLGRSTGRRSSTGCSWKTCGWGCSSRSSSASSSSPSAATSGLRTRGGTAGRRPGHDQRRGRGLGRR